MKVIKKFNNSITDHTIHTSLFIFIFNDLCFYIDTQLEKKQTQLYQNAFDIYSLIQSQIFGIFFKISYLPDICSKFK